MYYKAWYNWLWLGTTKAAAVRLWKQSPQGEMSHSYLQVPPKKVSRNKSIQLVLKTKKRVKVTAFFFFFSFPPRKMQQQTSGFPTHKYLHSFIRKEFSRPSQILPALPVPGHSGPFPSTFIRSQSLQSLVHWGFTGQTQRFRCSSLHAIREL